MGEKLSMQFSSLKSVRSMGIVNRKRKDQEYCSEKRGELYSGVQNLEMKNDMCRGAASVVEVNTAAVFSNSCRGGFSCYF